MGKSYRGYHPEQDFLLPPSLREWLPENHLVYFVSDVVDNLNLSALDAVYGDEQRGQPPYDPRMMTKVLVYGYCVEVRELRAQAEAADAAEDAHYGGDRRGDELPAELQRRETRLKKIRAAQRALEERVRQQAEKAGKPREKVQQAKPADKEQYNFTDPESRLMKGSDGLVQGN